MLGDDVMYSVLPLIKPPRMAKRKKDSGFELEAELATVAVQANTCGTKTLSNAEEATEIKPSNDWIVV